MARYVVDPAGNQLNLDNYIQEPGIYIGDFTLTASQSLNYQSITLSGMEAYFMVLRLLSTQTNAFRVRLYQSQSGRDITMPSATNSAATAAQARSDLLYGTAGRPAVLPCPWLIYGSGLIIHDFTEIAAAGNTLHLEYHGIKLTPR